MAEQAERMSRLVDDLLSLSRVEMREYLPLADEVALETVLTEVAQTLEPLAQQASIQLTLESGDGAPSCVATATSWRRCFRTCCRTPSSTAVPAARSR